MPDKKWNCLEIKEISNFLDVNTDNGLDNQEVEERKARDGPNIISKGNKSVNLERIISQFKQPLVYILVIASIITLFLQEWLDSLVIIAVVVVNILVGYFQESKASNALEALSKIMTTECAVIRNFGKKDTIDGSDLVIGDIVVLKSGDKVAADLRLINTKDLKIDESTLTGESIPVEKDSIVQRECYNISDMKNMAFGGTLVTQGQAKGVVVSIGDRTETGRISKNISIAKKLATPLSQKITALTRMLLYIIGGFGALTFAIGIIQSIPAVDMFIVTVSLAVAAIPEGLPAALTITLSIGVNRMAKRNAIIRKLPAVETLGSTTVICSDKTGTLTQNEMTVSMIVAGNNLFEVTGSGYHPEGFIRFIKQLGIADENVAGIKKISGSEMLVDNNSVVLRESILAGFLCNDSQLVYDRADKQWKIKGDPTEGALIVLSKKAGLDEEDTVRKLPRLDSIPFESHLQYMATLHRFEDKDFEYKNISNQSISSKNVVYIKGALEKILSNCNRIMVDSVNERNFVNLTLTGDISDRILHQAEEMALTGLRIIGFARLDLDNTLHSESLSEELISDGLIFLGFAALIDPPREESIQSIAACHTAGIDVKMITGDNLQTAVAIARKLGLGVAVNQRNDISYETEGENQGLNRQIKWIKLIENSDYEHVHEQYLDSSLKNERFINAISGNELRNLSREELGQIIEITDVFARVSPDQKFSLVKALQENGHIVAMTGDGVNDAPALKQADIGISMGITGTEVAKEASDMILTDDNFASIKSAIEEGRTIFDNLLKFLVWTLTTNFGEAFVLGAAFFMGIALPLLPIQILWINMTTALTLGLMLIFEPKEVNIMNRPPRPPKYNILNRNMLERIVVTSGLMIIGVYLLFLLELDLTLDIDYARTVTVNLIVMIEIFYLLSYRSFDKSIFEIGIFSNKLVIYGIIVMVFLQLFFIYLPQTNFIFETKPLTLQSWLRIIVVSAVLFIVVEIYKKIRWHNKQVIIFKSKKDKTVRKSSINS